jgi:cysteine synthase A
MGIAGMILTCIGGTPLVRLSKVARDLGAEVVVKPEYLNPSGSIKDRVALRMIDDAERVGLLRPGMEIVEASTGNTATSLAFVGAVKGYRVHLFIPNVAVSEERLRILKSYGAAVTEVDITHTGDGGSTGGLHGSIVEKLPRVRCYELEQAEPDRVWWARQFSNPSNVAAHREGTAREIIEQSDGQVDAFVAAIGTCGTLIGCAEALRAHRAGVLVAAVEPRRSPAIRDGKLTQPIIENISGGLLARMVDERIADRIIHVDQGEAIAMAHRLCQEEGLFCGLSSGANVVAALELARELGPGKRVATVLPDSRDRYLFKEQLTT